MTLKLKKGISISALESLNKTKKIEIKNINKLGYIDVEIPKPNKFYEIYNYYLSSGLFDVIEINSFGKPLATPNDPQFVNQYYLYHPNRPHINIPNAWDIEKGNSSVIIAVIDDGVARHSEINFTSPKGYDFILDIQDPTPKPSDYHGTHVSGIIAANTNNAEFIAGISGGWNNAPQSSKIMDLRVIDSVRLETQYVDDAILYAAENGAKIINMSFQMDELEFVNEAIQYVYGNYGCLLVASAGNDPNADSVYYPARNSYVVAVAGIKWKDWKHYGNTGEEIDITAPADDIVSTIKINGTTDGIGIFSGTSQSCAMVSGVAALLISHYPDFIPMDIKNALYQNAIDIGETGFDEKFGWGLLNARNSFRSLYTDPYYIPERPYNLTISGTPGNHPTLTWNTLEHPYSISHYNIYRSNGGYPGRYDFVKIADKTQEEMRSLSWTDNSVTIANQYQESINMYYRVTSVANNGYESITSDEVSVAVPGYNGNKIIPTFSSNSFYHRLYNNYPNPFNLSTKIRYELKENTFIKLTIYDILGRNIKTLVNEMQGAGYYTVIFNADDLPSGIYFYQLRGNDFTSTKKFTINK